MSKVEAFIKSAELDPALITAQSERHLAIKLSPEDRTVVTLIFNDDEPYEDGNYTIHKRVGFNKIEVLDKIGVRGYEPTKEDLEEEGKYESSHTLNEVEEENLFKIKSTLQKLSKPNSIKFINENE